MSSTTSTDNTDNIYTKEDFKKAIDYALSNTCSKKGGIYNNNKCIYTKTSCDSVSVWPFDESGQRKPNLPKGSMYTEWIKDPNNPLGGKCMIGFELYRSWCENPNSRNKDDGSCSIQNMCGPDTKFVYDKQTQTCSVTPTYCSSKGVSYADGECYVPLGQEWAEALLGKTIWRGIAKGKGIPITETVKAGADKLEDLAGQIPYIGGVAAPIVKVATLPYVIPAKIAGEVWGGIKSLFSDCRLKTNISLLIEDYAGPGVNLYSFNWNRLANKLYSLPLNDLQIGFLASEIEQLYPDIVYHNKHGHKHIVINQNTYKTNPFYNLIYVVLTNHHSITKMIDHNNPNYNEIIKICTIIRDRFR